jgi:hypothetical protein
VSDPPHPANSIAIVPAVDSVHTNFLLALMVPLIDQ